MLAMGQLIVRTMCDALVAFDSETGEPVPGVADSWQISGDGSHFNVKLRKELKEHVVREIGALARPDDVRFTEALPKTRSGKIMRRLLRDIAAGKETVGDTTTLEDYSVLAKLREDEE